ncbi:hypothetical protein SUGI_0877250 [Cryptomeria japonica]|nr:hypothetical protein SUGI_0877250 [Cryptomeria japonica]
MFMLWLSIRSFVPACKKRGVSRGLVRVGCGTDGGCENPYYNGGDYASGKAPWIGRKFGFSLDKTLILYWDRFLWQFS